MESCEDFKRETWSRGIMYKIGVSGKSDYYCIYVNDVRMDVGSSSTKYTARKAPPHGKTQANVGVDEWV